MTTIPSQVLAGVTASECISRAIPPLSGIVVLTWYATPSDEMRWMPHGLFADVNAAEAYVKTLNSRHHAALLVPVEWRSKP